MAFTTDLKPILVFNKLNLFNINIHINFYKSGFSIQLMGLIRGGVVLFLGVLLFVSFLAMNTLATFSSSLSYENVRNNVYPIAFGIGDSSLSEEVMGNLNLKKVAEGENLKASNYCNRQNTTIYNFSYEGFMIDVPCTIVAQGTQAILNETISDVVYGIYYTQYNCSFWNCFSENQFPSFLISQKAQDYWQGKFYIMLLISLILAVLIFIFMENRINAPIILGILLVLSGLPVLKLSALIYAFVGKPLSFVIGIFFSKAALIFWISLVIGLAFIAVGFASRIMNLGFIKNLIKKGEEKGQAKTVPQIQPAEKPKQTKPSRKKK